jgi:hypothetical protein
MPLHVHTSLLIRSALCECSSRARTTVNVVLLPEFPEVIRSNCCSLFYVLHVSVLKLIQERTISA